MRKITEIIIHCADTPASMDIGVEEIDQWHKARGWDSCGYHYVIRRNGKVEYGRDENEVGAHAYGHNHNSLGVCLVGGKPDCNYTAAQWKALEELVWDLMSDYPDAVVLGHRDVSRKDCPMFDARAWVKSLTS